jgi:hypothetical protein
MSFNNVIRPSTTEALNPAFVTGEPGEKAALLEARVTQLEEERPKIVRMLQQMESLVRESLSKQSELEKDVQRMQESLERQTKSEEFLGVLSSYVEMLEDRA